jgi:predicted neuraminidase
VPYVKKVDSQDLTPVLLLPLSLALVIPLLLSGPQTAPVIVATEFIFERAPFRSAHASTIVETRDGLVAAWFGGTAERNPDVGIWVSRRDRTRWSAPVEVATGIGGAGTREPCWNPVLFQPSDGPLLLFYKVGPNPREWKAFVRISIDHGRTWSAAIRLPAGVLGPIRAKPVELSAGTLLAGSSTEHAGWKVHIERFAAGGEAAADRWSPAALSSASRWRTIGPLNDPREFGAIQPTILVHSPTRLQILCRSQQGVVTESWSEDAGLTWSRMTATALPNPNAGIDAVRLADGRFLLAYNPIKEDRHRLDVAVSSDGRSWQSAATLEDSAGEYSYPAMIQARDGLVHVTYTWKRERIKHVVLDPRLLQR